MSSVLGVGGSDLERLTPKDAVVLFAELLWADARALGIPAPIDAPRNIDAPDGGIDATVRAPQELPGPSAIRPGTTRYQIKTTKGLNPSADSARKDILYTRDGALRPRVKKCLDEGGTLVIALFGTDTPASAEDAEDAIRRDLAQANPVYGSARVEVWRQNQLIGYLERHPSLCRRLKGTAEMPFLDHHHWASTSRDMTLPFFAGPSQKRLVERARAALCSGGKYAPVRIVGSPGSGKTRIAHEITRDPLLSSGVLYFERPGLLHVGNFLNRLLEDPHAACILVVDECDSEQHRSLVDRTAKTGGRVRLVTIHNKEDSEDCYKLDDLGLPEIKKIVESHGADIPTDRADELAFLCRPSPLYAHRLAEKMAKDPDGFGTIKLGEDVVHERYIGSGLGRGDREWARKRMSVLLWFSLFTKVGHERPYPHESEFLRKKCSKADGIPPSEFDTIVDELRSLKILQGHKELYIAPRMLHLWLWRRWWRLHGHGSDAGELVSPRPGAGSGPDDAMPDSLRRSFREMAADDPGSDAIAGAARDLLGQDGPFHDGAALEDAEGSEAFRALARAAPRSALALLERTLCRWDDARLGRFGGGHRRNVMWALEHMAPTSKHFEEIASVLLRLAANENEGGIRNNATGVFAGLFAMAPVGMPPTPASAEDRIGFLRRTLAHRDARCRMLAIAGCDSALESASYVRIDYERCRIPPGAADRRQGGAELGAYRKIISMLRGALDDAGERGRREAAAVLLRRAPDLSQLDGVSPAMVDALLAVLEKGAAARDKAAQVAELVLRVGKGRMGDDAASAYGRLAAELAGGGGGGGDYRSRMRRYVEADIPDDMPWMPDGRSVSHTREMIKELAAESLRDRRALLDQSDWLFGPRARHSELFGTELALQDAGCTLLPDLLGAMAACDSKPSASLISGYLGEVSLRDEAMWDDALDSMESIPRLAPLVPEAARWSKMTDRSWARLKRMYGRGLIAKGAFGMLAHGGRACQLSDMALGEALGILLDDPSEADMESALALLSGRCGCRSPEREIPLDAARRVVLDKAFLKRPAAAAGSRAQMQVMNWAAVAERVVRSDPSCIPGMADAMLGAMGAAAGVFLGPYDEALGPLDTMAARMPDRVWERASRLLAAPPDAKTYKILEWACGRVPRTRRGGPNGAASSPAASGTTLMDNVPLDSIWAWVDADAAARAACLARFARPRLDPGRGSLARELLVRYGGIKEVRDAMHRNFLAVSWTGSGVDHFAAARRQCEGIRSAEADPNVRLWLEERIRIVNDLMDKEAAFEERIA